jgi:hypothetical protein
MPISSVVGKFPNVVIATRIPEYAFTFLYVISKLSFECVAIGVKHIPDAIFLASLELANVPIATWKNISTMAFMSPVNDLS